MESWSALGGGLLSSLRAVRSGEPDHEGAAGRFVEWMMRRSLRGRFRNVFWQPPKTQIPPPAIFAANHHGWFDGYVMYFAVKALGHRSCVLMEEMDAFPLFSVCGAVNFPPDNAAERSAALRRCVRYMKNDPPLSMFIFPEQVLHRPPEIYSFARSLSFFTKQLPESKLVPCAIRYEFWEHERPEAYVAIGEPMEHVNDVEEDCRQEVSKLLDELDFSIGQKTDFPVLVPGTPSVNERWGLSRRRSKTK